jgi:hypothetical protein
MPSGIGSWRRPENSARFVVRRPREERRATFTVADETHSGLRPPGHNPNNQLQMSPVQAVGRFQTKSANPSRTWLSGYGRGRPPHLPLSWA